MTNSTSKYFDGQDSWFLYEAGSFEDQPKFEKQLPSGFLSLSVKESIVD